MSKRARRSAEPDPGSGGAASVFHRAEVLYALEWASVAPGLGGWNLLLDDETATRLISVVPPGSERPTFFITREGLDVTLAWVRQRPDGATPVEVGRFRSLREAVLRLCPLDAELRDSVNESMRVLYPRAAGLG
jgi:hypothetical protein